jgi:integrase
VSVERTPDGKYKVRWRDGSRNRARRFDREGAAYRFDERVRELKALGELHRLDERPRGVSTVAEWTRHWWETYAEPSLGDATQDNYDVQLRLRILPRWGAVQLRDLDGNAGAVESWVAAMHRDGVGDATILQTLAVLSGMLRRAERDGEIARNPVPLVEKPSQTPKRDAVLVTPLQVEKMRAWLLAERPKDTRLRDATLVSVLAYAGPRPESEALPLTWDQVGQRTITFVATKHGRGTRKPRHPALLPPLAHDLRQWRMAAGRPPASALVFPSPRGDRWSGDDWDNWRERVFDPAAEAVGLPEDVRPRDLRGSFVSLLVYEGMNIVEVAKQLGHAPATCLRYYARVFDEFDPADRRPAEEIIRDAREAVARGDDDTMSEAV